MTAEPSPPAFSILDHADEIRAGLEDENFDVAQAVANGTLVAFADAPPHGYAAIPNISVGVALNAQLRYRYLEYAGALACIDAEIESGRRNITHVIDALRARGNLGALSDDKVARMNPVKQYGQIMIDRPFMGATMAMRRDMCIPFHHFVLQRLLRSRLTPELDAVFEIGAGVGDSLVELAIANPYPGIRFFGGEIARNGQKCLRRLAGLAGLDYVRAVDFDIGAPDFQFLTGVRRVLVFSQFALVYPPRFPEDFFERLFAHVETAECMLFEPISFALAKEYRIEPMFPEVLAGTYGVNAQFWSCIRRMERAGRVVIDELIPDVIGKTKGASVSLVRLRTA